jgi:succinate-acetate transporter protein
MRGKPAEPPIAPAAPAPTITTINWPTIGDPAPLGLACFGITTLCLSVINAGWIGAASVPMVLALALPLGGGTQILAGMWAYRRGSTFAATAFSAYGAFWLSVFVLLNFNAATIVKAGGTDSLSVALGMFFLAWGIFTAYMLAASFGGARSLVLVFALLTLTFFALAIGEWANPAVGSSGELWHHIGGYLGVATAVGALYVSFADVLNANFKQKILPT